MKPVFTSKLNNEIMSKTLFSLAFLMVFSNCQTQTNKNPNAATKLNINTSLIEESVNNINCNDAYDKTAGTYELTTLGCARYEGGVNHVIELVAKGACIKECSRDEIYTYDLIYTAFVFNRSCLKS